MKDGELIPKRDRITWNWLEDFSRPEMHLGMMQRERNVLIFFYQALLDGRENAPELFPFLHLGFPPFPSLFFAYWS